MLAEDLVEHCEPRVWVRSRRLCNRVQTPLHPLDAHMAGLYGRQTRGAEGQCQLPDG